MFFAPRCDHFALSVGLVLPARNAMCFNVGTVATVRRVRRACLCLGAALVLFASGCTELRGRRRVREGNRLYREGRYREAVTAYEQAESLIPNFWLLWLNKGLTCRQLMIPGSRQSTNLQATDCALAAFEKLRELRPSDQRGDSLYVQTLFDGDRFQALADLYQARLRTNPSDLLAMSGLIQVYTRWNRLEEALQWYQRRAALAANDAEAQYAVGVFIWSQLFQKGGSAEMAAFDPRPDPSKPKEKKTPPPMGLGDIVGAQRVRLADLGISYLERALKLRPRYPEALVYLSLLGRQKAIGQFADPKAYQASIDAAEKWRRQAEATH
jgi:tetratricopeptide (TPR) repeat protein